MDPQFPVVRWSPKSYTAPLAFGTLLALAVEKPSYQNSMYPPVIPVPVWMPFTLDATSRFETNVPLDERAAVSGTPILSTSCVQASKLVHTQFVVVPFAPSISKKYATRSNASG